MNSLYLQVIVLRDLLRPVAFFRYNDKFLQLILKSIVRDLLQNLRLLEMPRFLVKKYYYDENRIFQI